MTSARFGVFFILRAVDPRTGVGSFLIRILKGSAGSKAETRDLVLRGNLPLAKQQCLDAFEVVTPERDRPV